MEKPKITQLAFFDEKGNPTDEANLSKGKQSENPTYDEIGVVQEIKKDEPKPFMTVEEYQAHKEDNEGLEWWQK
jgi:hypothetical protein